jgi:GNAT superfamily N-acetyltransferase
MRVRLAVEFTRRLSPRAGATETRHVLPNGLSLVPGLPFLPAQAQLPKAMHWLTLVEQRVAIGVVSWDVSATRARVRAAYVLPEFRGRGLSSVLMERALRQMADAGCEEVCYDVGWHNAASRALAERCGFRMSRGLLVLRIGAVDLGAALNGLSRRVLQQTRLTCEERRVGCDD